MLLPVTFANCETLVPGFFMQIVTTWLSYHCSCHHFTRASNAMKFNPLQRRCVAGARKNRTCNWTLKSLNFSDLCTLTIDKIHYKLSHLGSKRVWNVPVVRKSFFMCLQKQPLCTVKLNSFLRFVMLLWVYIHTGRAWKICLPR
jgi:hypothetical protein